MLASAVEATFELKKEFKIEYSHRLMYHKGDCRNIHGHSAKIIIQLWASKINTHTGMIMDFGEFEFFKTYLDTFFDHSLILNSSDPLLKYLEKFYENFKIYKIDGEPTAENLSKLICEQLNSSLISKNLIVDEIKVTFFETEKNSASFHKKMI